MASKSTGNQKQHHDKPEDHWDQTTVLNLLGNGSHSSGSSDDKASVRSGQVRVNQRNYQECYIKIGEARDALVKGMFCRNRALNGDKVAVVLFPRKMWRVMSEEARDNGVQLDPNDDFDSVVDVMNTAGIHTLTAEGVRENLDIMAQVPDGRNKSIPDKYLQKTGRIVAILERTNSTMAVGHLQPMKANSRPKKGSSGDALFIPNDSRMPRMMVPLKECPEQFFEDPVEGAVNLLIAAQFKEWEAPSLYARGNLVAVLGPAGSIEAETQGILLQFDVDDSEFPEEAMAQLPAIPEGQPWQIPEEELAKRRDFRSTRILSIDPPTSRDLDDALSIEELPDGTFHVGVHIADVIYFVKEGTTLDNIARQRATTTYLEQRAYPMLPKLLSNDLCSLHPHVDRLAFSVTWQLDENGNITSTWMGRSVIRSCARLAYSHAQAVIDNPDVDWEAEGFPEVSNNFTPQEIKKDILLLNKLARTLRKKRFDNGALRLDKPKISFVLDPETNIPIDCRPYVIKAANELIEEYMLLANISVAETIAEHYPEVAMLRRHPPPLQNKLARVAKVCNRIGARIRTGSSKDVQDSINEFRRRGADDLDMSLLCLILSGPMRPAEYFASGDDTIEPHERRHFALSVPLYTHFTSPIRRYADVVVHRMLDAALNKEAVDSSLEEVMDIAKRCNERKLAAKSASDASSLVFAAAYIRTHGPFHEDAAVFFVQDRSFEVTIPRIGLELRVGLEEKDFQFQFNPKEESHTLTWPASHEKPATSLKVKVLSRLRVVLSSSVVEGKIQLDCDVLRPDQ